MVLISGRAMVIPFNNGFSNVKWIALLDYGRILKGNH
jgi:hypothetical protein